MLQRILHQSVFRGKKLGKKGKKINIGMKKELKEVNLTFSILFDRLKK